MADSQFKKILLHEAARNFNYSLANAALARNSGEEACILFQRTLAQFPDHAKAAANFALALTRLGRQEEAAGHQRLAEAAGPRAIADARCDLGDTLGVQSNPDDAIVMYEQALEAMPDHPQANLALGMLQHAKGRTIKAGACFRRLLAIGGNDADDIGASVFAHIAHLTYDAHGIAAARPFLRRAQCLDPASALVFSKATKLLSRAGEMAEASIAGRHLVRLEPSTVSYYLLADTLFAQFRVSEAAAALQAALDIDATADPAYFQLGVVAIFQNRMYEAEQWLIKGLSRRQEHTTLASTFNQLGLALLGQRRFEEADRSFESALRHFPDLLAAKAHLGLVRLAQGRIEEALELTRSCVAANPSDFFYLSCHGLSLQAAGRLEEAIGQQRRAVALHGFPWAYTNLALALEAAGHDGEALKAHRRAVIVAPEIVVAEAYLRPWATDRLLATYRRIGVPVP